jgi:hypothetical protein
MVSRRRSVRPRIASGWPRRVSGSSRRHPDGIPYRRRPEAPPGTFEDQFMECGDRVEPAAIQCQTDGSGALFSFTCIDYARCGIRHDSHFFPQTECRPRRPAPCPRPTADRTGTAIPRSPCIPGAGRCPGPPYRDLPAPSAPRCLVSQLFAPDRRHTLTPAGRGTARGHGPRSRPLPGAGSGSAPRSAPVGGGASVGSRPHPEAGLQLLRKPQC